MPVVSLAILLAAILQFFDAATTARIVRLGGAELNPVMGRLIARLGLEAALALKLVLAVGTLAACYGSGFLDRAPWGAFAIAAMSLAVVANNLLVIVRLQRAFSGRKSVR